MKTNDHGDIQYSDENALDSLCCARIKLMCIMPYTSHFTMLYVGHATFSKSYYTYLRTALKMFSLNISVTLYVKKYQVAEMMEADDIMDRA